MRTIGLLDLFRKNSATITSYRLISESGNSFFCYNGRLYDSDHVRSCIRPKAQAVGKIVGKHIRKGEGEDFKINPEPYMRILLEEPNPYMTAQMLQEKLTVHLQLNNNAFALIYRDVNGYPIGIYPINATNVDALQKNGELLLRFYFSNGKIFTFKYTDIIHLRKDFNGNEIFGDNPSAALLPLMEVVTTTDQGLVYAIKNSSVIRWLLKFHQILRPEDLKKQTEEFVAQFLKIDGQDGKTTGAAATDAKFDAQQVEPKDYVPNAELSDRTVQRIYSFFNTNEKIVQSKFNEDEWTSYYEAEIEPVVKQLAGEFTRKLFTRKERGFGNKIVFESSNLTFASMSTKLGLVSFVDRGIMSPNEVREIMNLAPREGGDEFVLRLDTKEIGKHEE